MTGIEPVPESIDFPKTEEEILKYWKEIDAFQTSLKQSKGKPPYVFYDGPPFATGKPHYGHLLAGTIKDTVTRYWHQNGYHVERRFGWDTHGLPVEHEIDKTHGITGPEDVAKMGIDKYNALCRSIVMRYSGEWKDTVDRIGRWIDFENDYKTLYPWFMESVWWVFKQLFSKGLVYHGQKVMPFSTACNTPLSNFEAGQDYKDVNDPAVSVSFPLRDEPDVALVAWTTTPWTLPSNLSLCVHPDMDYVKILQKKDEKKLIVLEARLSELFKNDTEYDVLEKFKGRTLEGKKYVPLFDYFVADFPNAHKVCCDTYVTADSGTGVVHQAPYFGADDFRVGIENNIITKDGLTACPVDNSGKFTNKVPDYKGLHVKDADKEIIKTLKGKDRVIKQGQIKHSYPFCWRSGTPLIYKAVPSWFVRVEHAREQLLKSNDMTTWVPSHVKEKRFGNWLKNANDWCISRNRYWGTPIPLWASEDLEEIVCIGSIKELAELSGVTITDLHRESIDHITIPSKTGRGVLKRIPEVFDCWFESGSMPYAQKHYPFDNKKAFEDTFPAHFIAEGIDQTRGWFYTLIVLSTHLFGKAPFKNVIVNGLVLAEDGNKMSKSKRNFPDPKLLFDKYGADAIRLYLISSVAVAGGDLRFKEQEVKEMIRDVFLPWYNAYRFLVQNILRHQIDTNSTFTYDPALIGTSDNIMDKWILSYSQSLIKSVKEEMETYHLNRVVPKLLKFVDQLTNWYVRLNRRRLKGETGAEDCVHALTTLYTVIDWMNRLMAPATPFLTEHLYQNLRRLQPANKQDGSIHFQMMPEVNDSLIQMDIERAVSNMTTVVQIGRALRDRKTLPEKYPLPEIVVIRPEQVQLDELKIVETYIMEQLNVRKVTFSADRSAYGVELKAEPEIPILGKRLGKQAKALFAEIRKMDTDTIEKLRADGKMVVGGHEITKDEIRIQFNAKSEGTVKYEADSEGSLLVLLNISLSQDMIDEGVSREVVNRVQKLKKKAKLVVTDEVTVFYQTPKGYLDDVITSHFEKIQSAIRATFVKSDCPGYADVCGTTKEEMKGEFFKTKTVLNLQVAHGTIDPSAPVPLCVKSSTDSGVTTLLENPKGRPAQKITVKSCGESAQSDFVNLEFVGNDRYGVVQDPKAAIILNNFGHEVKSLEQVESLAADLFGWGGDATALKLFFDKNCTKPVKSYSDLKNATVFVKNLAKPIA